jgi:hypothetical protein
MKGKHFVKVVEKYSTRSHKNFSVVFVTLLFWWRICLRTNRHHRIRGIEFYGGMQG